jgi:ferritin-like metal-binding protein YciE
MTEPRELLLHEMGDLLFAEQTLVKALPKLASEATDKELRSGFETHLQETKQHVDNLKAAFEAIGEEPKAEKCPGIEGIKKEHDQFMSNEEPSPELRNLFLTGAGTRAEHYEIAAYEGLITLANGIGESQIVPLLEENLEQEKAALEKLKTTAKRLTRPPGRAARRQHGHMHLRPLVRSRGRRRRMSWTVSGYLPARCSTTWKSASAGSRRPRGSGMKAGRTQRVCRSRCSGPIEPPQKGRCRSATTAGCSP